MPGGCPRPSRRSILRSSSLIGSRISDLVQEMARHRSDALVHPSRRRSRPRGQRNRRYRYYRGIRPELGTVGAIAYFRRRVRFATGSLPTAILPGYSTGRRRSLPHVAALQAMSDSRWTNVKVCSQWTAGKDLLRKQMLLVPMRSLKNAWSLVVIVDPQGLMSGTEEYVGQRYDWIYLYPVSGFKGRRSPNTGGQVSEQMEGGYQDDRSVDKPALSHDLRVPGRPNTSHWSNSAIWIVHYAKCLW